MISHKDVYDTKWTTSLLSFGSLQSPLSLHPGSPIGIWGVMVAKKTRDPRSAWLNVNVSLGYWTERCRTEPHDVKVVKKKNLEHMPLLLLFHEEACHLQITAELVGPPLSLINYKLLILLVLLKERQHPHLSWSFSTLIGGCLQVSGKFCLCLKKQSISSNLLDQWSLLHTAKYVSKQGQGSSWQNPALA